MFKDGSTKYVHDRKTQTSQHGKRGYISCSISESPLQTKRVKEPAYWDTSDECAETSNLLEQNNAPNSDLSLSRITNGKVNQSDFPAEMLECSDEDRQNRSSTCQFHHPNPIGSKQIHKENINFPKCQQNAVQSQFSDEVKVFRRRQNIKPPPLELQLQTSQAKREADFIKMLQNMKHHGNEHMERDNQLQQDKQLSGETKQLQENKLQYGNEQLEDENIVNDSNKLESENEQLHDYHTMTDDNQELMDGSQNLMDEYTEKEYENKQLGFKNEWLTRENKQMWSYCKLLEQKLKYEQQEKPKLLENENKQLKDYIAQLSTDKGQLYDHIKLQDNENDQLRDANKELSNANSQLNHQIRKFKDENNLLVNGYNLLYKMLHETSKQ